MSIETGRLMEMFGSVGWEFDERGGLEKFNPDRTRRLFYIGHELEGDGVQSHMGLSFLNESGGWTNVFTMNVVETSLGRNVSFTVDVDWENDGDPDREIFFSYMGGRSVRLLSFTQDEPMSKRVEEDRKELMYPPALSLVELDYEATANLFIEQLIKGEMTRPVLVEKAVIN